MTNGTVVVLGSCGRNFAAGMSGGRAFVFDESGKFASKYCNHASVDLDPVTDEKDLTLLKTLIERHLELTDSPRARMLLDDWDDALCRFVLVFPHELKRVLGVPRSESAYSAPPLYSQAANVQEVQRG